MPFQGPVPRGFQGLHEVEKPRVEGRRVLLFDDLFRSGATMKRDHERAVRQRRGTRRVRSDPEAAAIGLMGWDGQSRGTLMNVLRLADRNKPVVVYVQPGKGFVDVRTQSDLSVLLAELDRQAASRLHADAIAEGLGQGLADQAALGF
jgi:hypothetical protein